MARILLIEDDELFRRMLRNSLAALGHEVTEAQNGLQGLKLHSAGGFDLVVTDVVMPEREGIETILELRQRNPDVKIIAMSGGGRGSAADYLHIAAQVGAQRVLLKPFSIDELKEAIHFLKFDVPEPAPAREPATQELLLGLDNAQSLEKIERPRQDGIPDDSRGGRRLGGDGSSVGGSGS
jgi:CheY-like chemotaxis protein